MKTCTVPGCETYLHDGSKVVRGLCQHHYFIWRKYRLGWKEIDAFILPNRSVPDPVLYCVHEDPKVDLVYGFPQCRKCGKPPLASLSLKKVEP